MKFDLMRGDLHGQATKLPLEDKWTQKKPFGSIGKNAGRSRQETKKSYLFLQISEKQKRLF